MSLDITGTALWDLHLDQLIKNMLYLLTYTDIKNSNILPTNNHLEGMFGHIKERIKIHRGFDKNWKKKAIKFLLKNWGKKVGF